MMNICILIHTNHFFLQAGQPNCNVYVPLPFYLAATNDREFVRKNYYSEEVVSYIGSMTTKSKYDYGFMLGKIEDKDGTKDLNRLKKVVYDHLSFAVTYFEEFLSYLWFVKDNSISGGLALAQIEGNAHTLISLQNNRGCTMADGNRQDAYISQDDVNTAIEIIEKIKEICPNERPANDFITPAQLDKDGKIINTHIRSLDDHTHYFEFNCIQRALSLLSILRGVSFLPYKISLYIPILESLFSPSDGELTFKVSQRVAFYIGENMDEIKSIFEQVRRVYEIRSRYLHGQKFEKKSIKLDFKEESKNMDNILRRVLTKVILHDSKIFLGDDREKVLSDLVFKNR